MKKGQFTLFVIIGVVLLLLIGVGYYYRDSLMAATGISSAMSYPSEIQEIVDYTDDCLEDLSNEAIQHVSAHAGYMTTDEDYSFKIGEDYIPYAYYDGYNTLLSLEQIESSISAYVTGLASYNCYIENPYLEDFEMELDEVSSETSIEEGVELVIDFPMVVREGENSYSLTEEYVIEIPARLEFVHNVSNEIIELSVEEPSSFNYEEMASMGVNVTMYELNDEVFLFEVTDPEVYNDVYQLTFMFAAFFPYSEEVDEEWEELLE